MTADTHESGARTGLDNDPRTQVWAKRFVSIVVIAFAVGAVLNVAAELKAGPRERALMIRDDNSINNIVGTELDLVRGRFWIPSTVHDVAYGGTIVVPDDALINSRRFRDLSGSTIVTEDYDSDLTQGMIDAVVGLPKITGVGNLKGNGDFMPFVVVWSPDGIPVPVLRFWTDGETMYLIDDRLFGSEPR